MKECRAAMLANAARIAEDREPSLETVGEQQRSGPRRSGRNNGDRKAGAHLLALGNFDEAIARRTVCQRCKVPRYLQIKGRPGLDARGRDSG